MQISSNLNSVQLLQAQQAFRSHKPRAAQPEAPKTEAPQISIERPEVNIPVINPQQWRNTVQEVREIASQAGFIGLTERDIQRAYVYGESLLADYRV